MRSAFKNFGVTFIVSLIVFGIIAYFAATFVTGTVESILKSEKEELNSIISDTDNISDGTGGEISGDQNIRNEISGESFTMLIAVTDYMPGVYDDYVLSAEDTRGYSDIHPGYTIGILNGAYREAHVSSLVLVRADKETRSFVYLYLSPYMRVSTTGGSLSLSEIYYTYGMDRLEEHIYSLTGLDIDYSFLISGYNLDGFTSTVGTVLVSNPKDVYSDGMYNTYAATTLRTVYDENGEKTTATYSNDHLLYSGELDMTSQRLYTALSVIEHSKADLGTKQTVATGIVEAYMKSLAAMPQSKLSEVVSVLVGNNGILVTDFDTEAVGGLYDLFSRAGTFESVKLTYPCSYRSETDTRDEYFKPDVEKGLEMLNAYRKSGNN